MANPRTLAPTNPFPEKGYPAYEAKVASGAPGERGPLRFEEGIATDTDVPSDFSVGASQGNSDMARYNHNQKVDTKYAEETMQQRMHVGSAAWIEAPTMLGEFATGSVDGDNDPFFPLVGNPGSRQQRISPTVIQ